MTIYRERSSQLRWWHSVALAAATCLPSAWLSSLASGQDFQLPPPAAVVPAAIEPTFAPPLIPQPALEAPATFPQVEAMPAAQVASYGPPSFGTANYEAPNYAELEARLRDLEARYQADTMRFASMAAEMADGKSDAKAPAAAGTVVGSDLKMNGSWKDGGQMETADKAFRMKWRGRTQFDGATWTDPHDTYWRGLGGNLGDTAVDFRRLRLGTEGVLYEQFDFAVELDFINSFNTNGGTNAFAPNNNLKNAFDRQFFGVPAPTDVWIGIHELPIVGNMRIGNIKPANGLEHANSSRFLDFMERNLMQDAFTGRFNNGFQPGLLFNNWNENQTATYQSSITMNTYNVFAYDAGGPDWANRITWTPINDKESHGRYLLHLGLSATERRPTDGQERIRARSSLRNGISQTWSNVADTTIFFCDNEFLVIPEIAAIYGPWHFQAEYFGQWNSAVRLQGAGAAPNPGPNQGTAYFNGYYAQVSYFLTGEHREYEGKNGCFGRVVPYENFYLIRRKGCPPLRTLGAWQVLYRYEVLDLNAPQLALVNAVGGGAAGVGGGTVTDHTFGINHFLNPNMKMQYNVVYASRSSNAASPVDNPQTGGSSFGVGARLAFDF